MGARQTVKACLLGILLLGVLLVFTGVVIEPLLPYFQVDAVLTQEELEDAATRERIERLLLKARGNRWLLWCGAGVTNIGASAVGLAALRRVPVRA